MPWQGGGVEGGLQSEAEEGAWLRVFRVCRVQGFGL